MSSNKRRILPVVVEVDVLTSSAKHCSNDCYFMNVFLSGPARCSLNDERTALAWDKRKKTDGYKRTLACRRAERTT